MSKDKTPHLDKISNTNDLKRLSVEELKELSAEVRQETIHAVSQTGGHLGAGLGVVELTVALHYCFNTPKDKIIWDVGHQAYPHKILTGRRDKIHTLRQAGGLSGFTKRAESPHDAFGAGHSSTSISAALGMAVARDLKDEDFEVIAVIGDGAMSAGMAYEAMNNAGALNKRLIVILNDNKMSIAPAVGAMSNYLSRLISSKPYLKMRSLAKNIASHLPVAVEKAAKKAEQYTKDFWAGGNLFEELGFYYVGPVDGHNISHLTTIFNNIKNDKSTKAPILIHVVTEKGHGYHMPEAKKEKLHAVQKFDVKSAKQHKSATSKPNYTNIFAQNLVEIAKQDKNVVAITAAMPSGTGLDTFAEQFPERMFDVGIAEQHAVTYAAGLAAEGIKPFCAIYSTFLQRGYDQIVHDVAIQKLPVRFAIDRADLVGADGPTHAGSFDSSFLATLPNFIIMAPSDASELARAVKTSYLIDDSPSSFRYPRGQAQGDTTLNGAQPFEIGKGRIIKQGTDIAILACGTIITETLKAANDLEQEHNISATIADARFIKPLDTELIKALANNHSLVILLDSSSIGGFTAHALEYCVTANLTDKTTIYPLHLPDQFIEHNIVDAMYDEAGLSHRKIVKKILSLRRKNPILKEAC